MTTKNILNSFSLLSYKNLNHGALRAVLVMLLFTLGISNAWAHDTHYNRANVAVATGSTGNGTVYLIEGGTHKTQSNQWDCGGSSSGTHSKNFECHCEGWADGYYFAGWNTSSTTSGSYASTSATATLSFGDQSSTSGFGDKYYYAWILGVKPTGASGDVSFNVTSLSATYTKTISFAQTGGDAQADFNNATIALKSGGGTWTHVSTTYNSSTQKVDVVFTYKSNRSAWTNAVGTRTDVATLTLSSKGNEQYSIDISANLPSVSVTAGTGSSVAMGNATETKSGTVTFPVTYVDVKEDLSAPTIAKTSGEGTWTITGYSYSDGVVTVNYSHTGSGTYGTRASAATITLTAKAGGSSNTCNVTATYPALAVTGGEDTGAYPLADEDAAGTATFFVSHADALSDFNIPSAVANSTGGTWTVDASSAVYTQSSSDPSLGTVTINYTYNAGELFGAKTAELTLTAANGSSYVLTLTGERAAPADQDVSVTTAGGVETKYDTWAEGLAAANAADGCTLKLLRDVSGLAASQEITKTMTLDLNHNTLSGTLSAAGGLIKLNTAGKVLTITDGKSDGAISVSGNFDGRISAVEILKGSLVLSKVSLTAENANTGTTQANIYLATVYLGAGTTMTMTSGNITGRRTGASGSYCYGIYCAGTGSSASSVNLSGSTITVEFANGNYAEGVFAAGTSLIQNMTISGSAKTCAYAIWAQDGHLVVNGGTYTGITSAATARAIYTKTNPATKNALTVQNAILNATAGTTDAKGIYCQSTSATISGDPTDANIALSNVTINAKTDETTGTEKAYAIFTDAGVCLAVNGGTYTATTKTTTAYAVRSSGYTAILNGTFNANATTYLARALNIEAGITAVRNGIFNATADTEQSHAAVVASGAKLLVYGGIFTGKLNGAKAGAWATGTFVNGGTLEAQGGEFIGKVAKTGLSAAQTNYAAGIYAKTGDLSLSSATLRGQTDNDYVNNAYALYTSTANASSLTNCTLQASSTWQYAYGIFNNGTPLTVNNSSITLNTVKAYDYGIYNNVAAAKTEIENSAIICTSGTTYAYGAYVKNGTLTANKCSFAATVQRTGATSADNCNLFGIYVNTGKSATLTGCAITATGSGSYSNNGYGIYVDGTAEIEDCNVTVSNINSGAYAICNTSNTTRIGVASGKFKATATSTGVSCNGTAAAAKQKLYGGYYNTNNNLEKYLPEGYSVETLPTTAAEYGQGYRYAIRPCANVDPVCKIGSTPYTTLEEALEFVNKNSGTAYTIVMVKNYTLPAGDYTLPAKASLLVPRGASQTALETNFNSIVDYNTYTTPSAFRTLTFASGVNMDVKGTIQVASRVASKGQMNGTNGTPYGPHGKIVLQENSKIVLESGAKIYAWGYITGPGMIDAKSGSSVYECMQIRDWRGGSNTRNIYSKVFPFNQYFIQNIESRVRFRPGAEETIYGAVNASSSAYPVNAKLIGTSGAMFLMSAADASEDTWVQKSYDFSRDYQVYEVNSAAQLNSLTVSGLPLIGSVSTSGYNLPLVNNMHIHLLTGKLEVIQSLLMQPGVIIEIDKEAKCEVASGKKIYVQDSEDTQGYDNSLSFNTVAYSPQGSVSGKRTLTDASINMHGTFEFNGYLYTSEHGANIFSTNEDAGTIIFKNASPGNENVNICNTGGTVIQKTFTTPQLKNADGETPAFTTTSGSVANDEYAYSDNQWRKWESSGCFTIDKTDNSNWKYYAKPAEYVQLTSNVADANHLYHDAATGSRAFIVEDGCIWWEVEPTPYDGNKYKCVDPDYDGRYKYYEYVSNKWQEATVTITWKNGSTTLATYSNALYGVRPTYLDANPSKLATSTEYYSWIGWTKGSTDGEFFAKDAELPYATEPTTYYAYFETHKYSYAVTFKNYDGSVLQATSWEAGQVPYYMSETDPEKPATAALVYTFTGWSPATFTAVTGSGDVYTAQFDAGTARTYTVQWVNYNGTVLKEEQVAYGTTPSAPATPTRPNDAFYTYTFNSWTPAITSVTGNQTYTATYDYSQKVTKYDIKFWNNGATIYTQSLPSGETPVYGGSTPSKDEDAQYTYEFDGWSATDGGTKLTSFSAVSGAANYYALYTHTTRKYTIRWKSEDGKQTLETDYNVLYGTTPSYDGAPPTKAQQGSTVYTFDGWSATKGGEKIALPAVTGHATYYAHFSDLPVHTVTFNANGHGTAPASQEVVHDQLVLEPAAPTADEWIFGGWYKEPGCTNAWNFATDVITADRSLYAKWTAAVATVTVNDVTTPYLTLNAAIDAANGTSNATVKMLQSVTITSQIDLTATMTINLNSQTITATQASATGAFRVNASGKTVTIVDNGSDGKIDHTATYNGYLYGINLAAGSLDIQSGTIYAQNDASSTGTEYRAIGINGAASTLITVSNGTIEAKSPNCKAPFGIYTAGNLTMTGGTIHSSGLGTVRGIYVKGTTTLSNVQITSNTGSTNSYAIFAKTGTLIINSGTFTATADGASAGYAIHHEGGTVNVYGGKFKGTNQELHTTGGTASISGGYYKHNTDIETNCADNHHVLSLPADDPNRPDYEYKVAEAYQITFNNHDGSLLQQSYQEKGKTPVYSGETPTKDQDAQYSYTHTGWTPALANVTAAATYTATFSSTPRTYTVTLNTNGGTINAGNVTEYTYGTGATLPTNVTKDGHEFGGWYTNSGLTGDAVTTISTTATGDKEYWAKWTASIADRELDIVDWTSNSITINVTNLKAVGGTNKNNWKIYVNDKDYTRTSPECSTQSRTLTISGLSLTPNENLLIQLKNDADVIESQHNYMIPQIYNAENATLSGTTEESVVYVYGGKLTISDDITLAALYVCPGAEVEVNGALTVGKLVLRTKPWATAAISGNVTATNVYYTRIAPDGSSEYPTGQYYQFGLPYECDINAVRLSDGTTPAYNTTWILKSYNEQRRAESGMENNNWDVLASSGTIAAGRGYEMFSSYKYYREYYFPVTPTDNTSVAVTRHGDDKNNSGWNIVCSPLMSVYENKSDPVNGLKVSWLLADGSYDQAWPETIWPALPFSYQASATGYLDFSSGNFNQTVAAPKRSAAYNASIQTEWLHLDVKDMNGTGDHTSIFAHPTRFDETYETGIDVAKQSLTASRAIIYSSHAYGEMAFAGVSDSLLQRGVALTVYSPKTQELTISMRDNNRLSRMAYVWLIDNETGLITDLLWNDYTFEAVAGTMSGRFIIQGAFFAPGVTTDLDNIQGDNIQNAKARKVIIDQKMYIQINGRLYDANGKLLKTEH